MITGNGVGTDSSKVATMLEWPQPKTIKELRGFLGLTGYYKRFIKKYAQLSKPLTSLLKKGTFEWSEEETEAFQKLKKVMTSAPLLALPDFSKPFIVEVDACGTGVGAVL